MGGHVLVIVWYGYLNSKYYLVIQNNYGERFCDDGLIKIELGRVGIENVAQFKE